MLQHTESYPTQYQWVITQSFAASDCLIILHESEWSGKLDVQKVGQIWRARYPSFVVHCAITH